MELTDIEALAAFNALLPIDGMRLLAFARDCVNRADACTGRASDAFSCDNAVTKQVLALAGSALLLFDVFLIFIKEVTQA